MIDRAEAEEHLRVIRSLMEKATVYRAVSAPGALIGGVLSTLVAAIGFSRALAEPDPGWSFPVGWGTVLVLTTIANLVLLRREQPAGDGGLFTPRMSHALRGMVPALLGGAALTFARPEAGWSAAATFWVLLYGVSLLAAGHFAPVSIRWLGRVFFLAGLLLIASERFDSVQVFAGNDLARAHLIMGATFGLFHIAYALAVWPRRGK